MAGIDQLVKLFGFSWNIKVKLKIWEMDQVGV